MGSRSRSTTTLTEENVQNIETRNLALSDFEGIGIGEAGRDIEISISQTDSGLVAAAENLGTGALNLAGDVTAQAIRSSESGLDRALDFGEEIFGGAIDAIGGATQSAIASTRSEASQSINQLIKFGGIAAAIFAFAFVVQKARA